MKKILLILGILMMSLMCMGQQQIQQKGSFQQKSNHSYNYERLEPYYIPNPDTIPLINLTVGSTEELNGWAQNGTACLNCPSYFYKILRSRQPYKAEDGVLYYYYYFYFFSNSYDSEGELTATSFTDIEFYANGEFVSDAPYVLLEPNKIAYVSWMRSIKPDLEVVFRIQNVSIFNIRKK